MSRSDGALKGTVRRKRNFKWPCKDDNARFKTVPLEIMLTVPLRAPSEPVMNKYFEE